MLIELISNKERRSSATPVRKCLDLIRSRSNDGFVLTVDDIVYVLQLPEFFNIAVYCICCDRAGNVHPSLSVLWNGAKAEQLRNPIQIEARLRNEDLWNKKKLRQGVMKSKDGWYTIYSPQMNHPYAEQILKDLARICELVRRSSLNIQNLRFREIHSDILEFQERLNDKKIQSISDICAFIRRQWSVHANVATVLPNFVTDREGDAPKGDALSLDQPILASIAMQLINEPRYIPMLQELYRTGCPVAGSIRHKNKRFCFLICPIAQRVRHPSVARRHILIWSLSGVKQTVAIAILECIDLYVTYSVIGGKARNIIDLDNRIIAAALSDKAEGRSALDKQFNEICHTALSGLLATTEAHSAVLRIYNPASRTLDVFAEEFAKWGSRDKTPHLPSIDIALHQNSLNAFTFLWGKIDRSYYYLPDTGKIPQELVSMGLKAILIARSRSKAEVCFCLFSGHVPFAVLNVEAEIIDAFHYDIEYCLAVKHALERFYEVNTKSRDTRWLAEGSSVFQQGHEIENLLSTDDFNEKQRAILTPYLLPKPINRNLSLIALGALVKSVQKWIASLKSPTNSKKAKDILVMQISVDVQISTHRFNRIFLIIQNLLINSLNYGKTNSKLRDKLTVEVEPSYRSDAEPYLSITLNTANQFSENVLDRLAIAPIEGFRRYRYGMFLVGVWARSMGGLVQVVSHVSGTVISVRLPLRGE